jgi:hypothetical protein
MKLSIGYILASAFTFMFAAGCGSASSGSAISDSSSIRGDAVEMWATSGGEELSIYKVEGRNYLLGRMGDEYQIWVANRTDARIEVVISVDGRDVISGKNANYLDDRGYVLSPGEEISVEGFRKSLREVAAFEFSSVRESYGARMGDDSNVGVIGLAVFDEGERRDHDTPVPIASGEEPRDYEESEMSSARPAASPRGKSVAMEPIDDQAAPGLGTKYGDEKSSQAEIVPFKRRDQDRPMGLMALYYDDREGLERMGVVFPQDPPVDDFCSGPNPFPGVECGGSYAPPPPPMPLKQDR